MVDRFGQDVRYAWRMVRRAPALTAIAIVSLALGIGANTAIFSLIDTLMLQALPVRAPSKLVELLSTFPGEPRSNGFAWSSYEHYRDNNHVFSDMIAVSPERFRVARLEQDTETLDGAYVSGNFFQALGVEPAAGRLIAPQDGVLNGANAPVAVVSWSYWQSRFNLDPHAVGARITVEGVPATVVGVAPRALVGVQVGRRVDIWVTDAFEPLVQRPSRRADGSIGVGILARLKPDVGIEQARAEMTILDRWRVEGIARARRSTNFNRLGIAVEPAASGFSGLREPFGRPLLILMAIVGVLLLIACGNVASMLMARGSARQGEMAVRLALGAGRARLVGQMLVESVLLSTVSAALGAFIAFAGARGLVAILTSGRPIVGYPGALEIAVRPDIRVLLFTVAVALATGLLFGIAPAWYASRSAPMLSLRESGAAGDGRSRRWFGATLVVGQVALSIALLSLAGTFIEHMTALRTRDLGFEQRSVVIASLDLSRSGYTAEQLFRPYHDVLRRLAALPGVRAATLSGTTPVSGAGASRPVNVEGSAEPSDKRPFVRLNWIGPGYFDTFGTPIVDGRDFSYDDEGRARVAIVSQAFARHYFADGRAVGRHFTFDNQTAVYEIVGVAGDAKYLDLKEAAPPTLFLHVFQDAAVGARQLSVRITMPGMPPAAAAAAVRRVVRDVLKTVNVSKVTTLEEQVNASIVPERLIATLAGWFSGLGALLAAIGLYGLLAFSVARRTREIGVRMALGATSGDVVAMVLKSAVALVLTGLAIGLPLALAGRRVAASQIDGLVAGPVVPLVAAAATMIVVAIVAAFVPARRASRVRPIEALRQL